MKVEIFADLKLGSRAGRPHSAHRLPGLARREYDVATQRVLLEARFAAQPTATFLQAFEEVRSRTPDDAAAHST